MNPGSEHHAAPRDHRPLYATVMIGLAAMAVLLVCAPYGTAFGATSIGQGRIAEIPVSFDVVNKNDLGVPCLSVGQPDGETYTVNGHITGPARLIDGKNAKDNLPSAALFNHGHGFAEFLWNFDEVKGYDTVQKLARKGQISVTYDRLGYESSDKVEGTKICYVSEADIAGQILDKLRVGDYEIEGRDPISFDRLALVGHSQSAFGNQILAYQRPNAMDAYVHISFQDSLLTPLIVSSYAANVADCETNPLPANQVEGNPGGYQFRGRTTEDFKATNFANIEPEVFDALAAMRNVDPCGYPNFSALSTAGFNNLSISRITAPSLLIFGEKDSNFVMPAAAELHKASYSGVDDLTLEVLPGAGHSMMFERGAGEFRRVLSDWLTERGFAYEAKCFGRTATIVGTGGDDRLSGTDGDDVIVGGGGNDTIGTGEGEDRVCSGHGNDSVDSGGGGGKLRSGHGNDRIDGGPGNDRCNGGEGRNVVRSCER